MAWPETHPEYKPASGIPAQGPGSGPGKGLGWGGPAKGAGVNQRKRAVPTEEQKNAALGVLIDRAMNSKSDVVRVRAAEAVLRYAAAGVANVTDRSTLEELIKVQQSQE